MFRIMLAVITLLVVQISSAGSSFACGECEYKDGLTGICLPKGGCLIPPLPDPIKIIKSIDAAIKSGNPLAMSEAVGDVLLNSGGCIGCQYVAQKVLPTLTTEQIQQIVGRGYITFLATGEPVLVAVDVITNIATQQAVQEPQREVFQPTPTARGAKSFTSAATCIVKRAEAVYVGWQKNPVLENSEKSTYAFPEVDLVQGDLVTVSSPECTEMNNADLQVKALTTAVIRYSYANIMTGGPDTMKYIFVGTEITP